MHTRLEECTGQRAQWAPLVGHAVGCGCRVRLGCEWRISAALSRLSLSAIHKCYGAPAAPACVYFCNDACSGGQLGRVSWCKGSCAACN